MESGRWSRVSWICLLLLSGGTCFPASKDQNDPHTTTGGSSGGSAPGSDLESKSSRLLFNLPLDPSTHHPGAAASQKAISSTGNESTSSLRTPRVSVGSKPSYELNRFIVGLDSSPTETTTAPQAPPQGAAYVVYSVPSPPANGTGKKPRSSSVQPQLASGPVGPAQVAPPFLLPGLLDAAVGNGAPTLDFGAGPVPYIGAPEAFSYGARYPKIKSGHASGNTATPDGLDADSTASIRFSARPAALETKDVGNRLTSPPGLPWVTRPSGAADSSFYNPTGGSHPYVAPATFSLSSGSPSVLSFKTWPTGGADSLYKATGGSYPKVAPATSSLGSGSGSPPSLSYKTWPTGGADSLYKATGGSYPKVAPATSILGSGSGSPPGLSFNAWPAAMSDTKHAGGADSLYKATGSSYPKVAPATPSLGGGSALSFHMRPMEGADSSFYNRKPALPPSTFLVQSRNGYQRALEVSSQTRYSPEYPNPPETWASRHWG